MPIRKLSGRPPTGSLHNYKDVRSAIASMLAGDAGDALMIDEATAEAALSVLALAGEMRLPVPKVFSHGSDAVVFTWRREQDSSFVTVSEEGASLMRRPREDISGPLEATVELVDQEELVNLLHLAAARLLE